VSAVETLSGWGRWPRRACRVRAPRDPDEVAPALAGPPAIARGLGRAYGDSALNPDCTIATRRLDRLLSFEAATGVLVAEAGTSLARIIETFLPRGFFPPVVPGTKFVTLGGAIAADVHGKNHHVAGSFGDHVLWLDLVDAAGETRRCSAEADAGLFHATLGGMGLTGIVLRAALRLMPVESGWIRQRTIVAPDLDAAIDAFEANLASTYSVAWIDALARGATRGRSLVHLGEHARADDLPPASAAAPYATPRRGGRRLPLDAPSWVLTPWAVRAFNHSYFRAGRRAPGERLVDWDSYFFPLDAIHDWNRIYGRRGFAQYQCALPLATAREGLSEMLGTIAAAGLGSFLSVLKRFGTGAPQRPLSFPLEGYTLALDFPLSPAALTLMDRLDEITLAAGGRLYLAKDSRMTQRTFEAGYGAGRAAFDAVIGRQAGRFASLQSRRLGI
jgi:FAD/FMN-containing dehydrogenase